MKKEYFTPDVWVLDLAAACMQEELITKPDSSGDTSLPSLGGLPARRPVGPASL